MKVSNRVGDLSGCTVWAPPRRSPASPVFRGPRTATSRPVGVRACEPGKVRGGGAVAASRAQAGRVTWAPERPRRRSAGPVRPGGLGNFPHYRCQLMKALMSPSAPSPPPPAEKVRGGGVGGLGFPPQSEPQGRPL